MNQIQAIYTPDVLASMKDGLDDSPEASILYNNITADEPGAHLWREHLNRWLTFGMEKGLIDADRLARLTRPDVRQSYPIVKELMAAYYFEKELGFPIMPNPKGHLGGMGDFSAALPGVPAPVFCEVKCPIHITRARSWSGNDADLITSALKSAYEQIPRDGQPSIAILAAELRAPISCRGSGITDALYGEDVFIGDFDAASGRAHDIRQGFIRNGFVQQTLRRHLSAVVTLVDWVGSPIGDALFKAVLSRQPFDSVDMALPFASFKYVSCVYHNPYAYAPIPAEAFKMCKQYTFDTRLRAVVGI